MPTAEEPKIDPLKIMREAAEAATQTRWELDEPSLTVWFDGRHYSGDPQDPDIDGGQEEIASCRELADAHHITNAAPTFGRCLDLSVLDSLR